MPGVAELGMVHIQAMFHMANVYGTYDAMNRLSSTPGWLDSLSTTNRVSFNRDMAAINRLKAEIEREWEEWEVAAMLGALAASGVAYDAPDHRAQLIERYTRSHEPLEPIAVGSLMDAHSRYKWDSVLDSLSFGLINAEAMRASVPTVLGRSMTDRLIALFSPGTKEIPASPPLLWDSLNPAPGGTYLHLDRSFTDYILIKQDVSIDISGVITSIYIVFLYNGTATVRYIINDVIHVIVPGLTGRDYYYNNGVLSDRVLREPLYPLDGVMYSSVWFGGGPFPTHPFARVIYSTANIYNEDGSIFSPAISSLPATAIVNNVAAAKDFLDQPDREDYIPIPFPPGVIPGSASDSLPINWEEFLRQLREYDPTKPLTQPGTGVMCNVCVQTLCICKDVVTTPPPPTPPPDINWPKLRGSFSGLANVFPFSLPFDLIGMFTAFSAEPKMLEPIEVNFMPFVPGDAGRIIIDFNFPGFDGLVKIFRLGMLILFAFGLVMATRGLITW
jgi:hypothetical protein